MNFLVFAQRSVKRINVSDIFHILDSILILLNDLIKFQNLCYYCAIIRGIVNFNYIYHYKYIFFLNFKSKF